MLSTGGCDGHGYCLAQTGNFNSYYRPHPCMYNCQLVRCPNYEICGMAIPECISFCHGGRCMNCNICIGWNLQRIDVPSECTICYNDVEYTFKHPHCIHSNCASCMRKTYLTHEIRCVTNEHIYDHEISDDGEGDDDNEDNSLTPSRNCPLCRTVVVPVWYHFEEEYQSE